jgi:hypothetical protein
VISSDEVVSCRVAMILTSYARRAGWPLERLISSTSKDSTINVEELTFGGLGITLGIVAVAGGVVDIVLASRHSAELSVTGVGHAERDPPALRFLGIGGGPGPNRSFGALARFVF